MLRANTTWPVPPTAGMNFNTFTVAGSNRLIGIWLFGKQAVLSVALQFPVFSGSLRKTGFDPLRSLEKSPLRWALVGAKVAMSFARFRIRVPCQPRKKNVLLRPS